MKIVFVSDAIYPYFRGGKEKRLYELSTRLARVGHDVHIYTMHWWDTPDKDKAQDGLKLHAISKLYPLYKGDKRSIREGVMFGLACLRLRKVEWDVLDVDHMPFFPIYAVWAVCRFNELFMRPAKLQRFFGTWHEALSRQDWKVYMGAPGGIAYLIEHLSIKLPNHISAASERTRKGLQALHGRRSGISLITPGVDFKMLDRIKPADKIIDIFYVGRLVKDKNIDKLVEAVGIIRRDHPEVRCVIAGQGPERSDLAAQIDERDLGDNIELLPPIPKDADVYAHMKAAHTYCLPSVREGFGMVALEALACGTPVITVDSPANAAKDLITDGKNGSVVQLSPTALAEALMDWLKKPKPTSIAKSVSEYDWDAIATQQAEVYAEEVTGATAKEEAKAQ